MKKHEWTEETTNYLINNYKILTNKQIADKLNVRPQSIMYKIHQLRLSEGAIKSVKATYMVNVKKDLHCFLMKKRKEYNAPSTDNVIRKIVKEWIALKKEKINKNKPSYANSPTPQ